MLNFRQFQAGPYEVMLKWLQTAIALRHSDTVDVKFILNNGGDRSEKTIALPHPELIGLGCPVTDPWCGRLAALHLLHMVATGEDMDKDLVTVRGPELAEYAAELERQDREELATRA